MPLGEGSVLSSPWEMRQSDALMKVCKQERNLQSRYQKHSHRQKETLVEVMSVKQEARHRKGRQSQQNPGEERLGDYPALMEDSLNPLRGKVYL